jgi:hypothetical protein
MLSDPMSSHQAKSAYQLLSCAAEVGMACAALLPPVVPVANPKGEPTAATFFAAKRAMANDTRLIILDG